MAETQANRPARLHTDCYRQLTRESHSARNSAATEHLN